jgi:succinate dehydrogenase / fumarate reductase, cytochrome b subunit
VKHKSRPTNVGLGDLLQFSWPITALASISHRIAGVVLFIVMGLMLYALQESLESRESFAEIKSYLESFPGQLICWGILTALAYHFVAGIKHLIVDGKDTHTLQAGIFAAKSVFTLTAVLAGLAAYWIF